MANDKKVAVGARARVNYGVDALIAVAKTRKVWVVVMTAGAVALALMGCTRTAQARGGGRGHGGGDYPAPPVAEEAVASGQGRGWQAPEALSGSPALSPRATERWDVADPASDRTGREVAGGGALETLGGKLAEQDGEWYLETETGRYLLHLGNAAFVERTGLRAEG